MQHLFITGIGTEVGKTLVSAIVTEALEADYWKPVQAGDLHHTDTDKVKAHISNTKSVFHPEAYALQHPMSPHAAAEKEGAHIDLNHIHRPATGNTLVIEGAGGLLVPLNDTHCIIDLIRKEDKVLVVSRHYLGSINHTLLTIEMLKARRLHIAGIIFSGAENPATEEIIKTYAQVPILGRIDEEKTINRKVVHHYATQLKNTLCQI